MEGIDKNLSEQNENEDQSKDPSSKVESESENEFITFGDSGKEKKGQNSGSNGNSKDKTQKPLENFFAIAQNYLPKPIESQEKSFLDSILPKTEQEKDGQNLNFLEYINERNREGEQRNSKEEESEFFGFNTNAPRRERKRSHSRESERSEGGNFRFSYCCQKCKRNDKHGKTCVCVVPANQRKVQIGTEGCRSCGCKGCTREDLENKRGGVRSACCKDCLKQFSKTGKSCPCQVPSSIRKYKLPEKGCKYCGCHGCASLHSNDNPRFHFKRNRKYSQSNRSSESESGSESYSDDINVEELNLNNFDNSTMGNFLTSSLSIYPPLIGFGIPQRTASYILGKSLHY